MSDSGSSGIELLLYSLPVCLKAVCYYCIRLEGCCLLGFGEDTAGILDLTGLCNKAGQQESAIPIYYIPCPDVLSLALYHLLVRVPYLPCLRLKCVGETTQHLSEFSYPPIDSRMIDFEAVELLKVIFDLPEAYSLEVQIQTG